MFCTYCYNLCCRLLICWIIYFNRIAVKITFFKHLLGIDHSNKTPISSSSHNPKIIQICSQLKIISGLSQIYLMYFFVFYPSFDWRWLDLWKVDELQLFKWLSIRDYNIIKVFNGQMISEDWINLHQRKVDNSFVLFSADKYFLTNYQSWVDPISN